MYLSRGLSRPGGGGGGGRGGVVGGQLHYGKSSFDTLI